MKNVQKIREAKKMTREELAYKSGTNYLTLRAYEKGLRNPSLAAANAIAAALGVTVEELG